MRHRTTAIFATAFGLLSLAGAHAFAQQDAGQPSLSAALAGCAQAGAQASPEAFVALDDNGDGLVSRQEYVEKCGKLGAAGDDSIAEAQFAGLDSNGDQRISSDEYQSPVATGAASAPPARAQAQANEAPSADELQAEALVGMEVVNAKGEELGEIKALALDDRRAPYAIVAVGGFLGIGAKDVAIPFDQLKIGPDTVSLMSETSKAELKRTPAYEGDFTPVRPRSARGGRSPAQSPSSPLSR